MGQYENYANNLSGRVGLDTTDFKTGISELDGGIRHIERSFQASAAVMGEWGSTSDGLKSRIGSLNDKMILQKKKLEMLNEEYQKAVKEHGATSAAAESLAQKMYKAQQEIERGEKNIKKYNDALSEMGVISEKNAKKLQDVGDKASNVGKSLTIGVTAPLIAAGTAAYKYSSDLTEAENKVDATFGASAKGVKKWAEDSLKNIGMAKSTALDAVSLYGDMGTSMGIPTKRAAEMSEAMVSLSADLSSFKNVSISQSQNALKGVFTGETESLKNLGIVMTETQLKQYALSQGYQKSYEDMTQAEKVQLRYNYVMENSKNAIGDYARTNGEAAGQVRLLPEALKELGASFGENIAPTITPMISGLNQLIISFGKLEDGKKREIITTAAIAAGLGPVLTFGGKTLTMVGKAVGLIKKLQTAKVASAMASKTAAAAESGLATATDTAAVSTKGLGVAMSTAVPYILAITAALAATKAITSKVEKEIEIGIDARYNKLSQDNEKYYTDIIDGLENEKQAREDTYSTETESTNKYYDDLIKKAEEYQKSQKSLLDSEKKALSSAHDERMQQLEAERDLKLKTLEESTDAATSKIQSQIDAIDAQTEAEEKALEEKQNTEKLEELKRAITNAASLTDRRNAQKEYSDFVNELERKKTLSAREEQKKQLQDQINSIKSESDAKKAQFNDEYSAAKKIEDDKLEALNTGIDQRLEALDGYAESQTEKLNASRDQKLKILEQETADVVTNIDARISEYQREQDEQNRIIEENRAKEKDDISGWGIFNPNTMNNERTRRGGLSFWEQVWANMIGANATGTSDWRGGLTRINEEGGEILNLPRHTQIIPHDVSMEYARERARIETVSNTANTYNYGARQHITQFVIGGRSIATAIEPETSIASANRTESLRRAGHVYK